MGIRSSILGIFFLTLSAQADFICRTEISYKWKKGGGDIQTQTATLTQVGITEELAKEKLIDQISIAKMRALEMCHEDHQNMSGCVASKFSALSNSIKSLSFAARKAMEDAISADCSSAQGQCLEALSSEAQCKEKIAEKKEEAVVSPTPVEEKAKGKKK